jgi:uncharacterized protein YqgV (UPF0045/DUF77 family)
MPEYYIKKEDINGNITFEPIDMNEVKLMGKSIKEIIIILQGLELERQTGIKMTMKNLQKYIDLIREEQEKMMQESINRMIKNLELPKKGG